MAANAIDLQPYASLNDEDCDERIARAKEALGDRLVNQVSVAKDVADNARVALQRMLDI